MRVTLSKWYLDLANKLSKSDKTFIRSLNRLRERSNESAKKANTTTEPPENSEIEFLYFRLIELFTVEDFDKLQQGVLKLFPQLSETNSYRNFTTRFSKQSETIQISSWQKLGYIYKDIEKRFIGPDIYQELPNLPNEVKFITVEVRHFLPSLIAVVFDVHLTEEASHKLNSLQRQFYFPETRFKNLIPWKSWRGYSTTRSETLQKRELLNWVKNLQSEVEKCIEPYIKGYFMPRGKRKTARLPSIEVFSLKGCPKTKRSFDVWMKKAYRWLESYAINFNFNSYRNESLFFILRNEDEFWSTPANRLIILWERLVKTVSTDGFGDDEKSAIIHNTQEIILEALVPCISILEFLKSIQKRIERLRKITFTKMISKKRLGSHINHYSEILQASMLLDRIALEFEQQKKLIQQQTEDLGNLTLFRFGKPQKINNLSDDFINEIEFKINLLDKYLSNLRTAFSDFVSIRNTKVTYRLQWIVFWLSVIATIATIISAIASWSAIKQFLQDVFKFNF